MPEYYPRVVDKELALRLEAFGATLIAGPKWCGKTTTGEQQAKSVLRMQDPDRREGYLATANTKPSLLGGRSAAGGRAVHPHRLDFCG